MFGKQLDQLVHLLVLIGRISAVDGVRHAVPGMVLENFPLNGAQCRFDRRELGQNINAVALVFDHANNTAHLTLDTFEAVEALFPAFRQVHGCVCHAVSCIPYGGMIAA